MKKLSLLLLVFPLAACAAPKQDAKTAAPSRLPSHASANDCAVISVAAYGNHDTRVPPPMSSKSYGADCGWNTLGVTGLAVAPPDPGPYYNGLRLFFRPPQYSGDDTEATVEYSSNANASASSYFFVDYKCSAKKQAGRWQFISCKTVSSPDRLDHASRR